jgi:outer membrane lipoprotein-sorting protein
MKTRQRSLLLIAALASDAFSQEAEERLKCTARAYKQLRSLQVEAEAERVLGGSAGHRVEAVITVYSVPPHKARVETKDSARKLNSLLVSNGRATIEYRSSRNEFTRLSAEKPLSQLHANGKCCNFGLIL